MLAGTNTRVLKVIFPEKNIKTEVNTSIHTVAAIFLLKLMLNMLREIVIRYTDGIRIIIVNSAHIVICQGSVLKLKLNN